MADLPMRKVRSVALATAAVLLAATLPGCAVAPAKLPHASAFQMKRLDPGVKVVHVRKIAHQVFGIGSAPVTQDVGAAPSSTRTRLLWRKRWGWNQDEHVFNRELHHGLRGGPIVSLDVPLGRPGTPLSIETRFSSFQYALPSDLGRPARPDEMMRERENRQSFEAGIYLNLSFDGR